MRSTSPIPPRVLNMICDEIVKRTDRYEKIKRTLMDKRLL
jgi:hypothetical protein